jgi:hypothetical protein
MCSVARNDASISLKRHHLTHGDQRRALVRSFLRHTARQIMATICAGTSSSDYSSVRLSVTRKSKRRKGVTPVTQKRGYSRLGARIVGVLRVVSSPLSVVRGQE